MRSHTSSSVNMGQQQKELTIMDIIKHIWHAFKHDMLLVRDSFTYYERLRRCLEHFVSILNIVDDFNYTFGASKAELTLHMHEIKRMSPRGDITLSSLREYVWVNGRFIDDDVWHALLELWEDAPT